MKFFLYALLGIWLWSGVFFLPQIEAQINKEEFQTLREEIRKELREELREEIEKELREEEKIRQKIQEIRQELREHLIIPCRNALEKRNPLEMRQHKDTLEKIFRELENITLKGLLEKHSEDKDMRMGLYYVARRKCEQQFNSEE